MPVIVINYPPAKELVVTALLAEGFWKLTVITASAAVLNLASPFPEASIKRVYVPAGTLVKEKEAVVAVAEEVVPST